VVDYVAPAEVGGVAVKSSFDVTTSDGNKNIFNGKKPIGAAFDAGTDVVAGKIAGTVSNKISGLEKGLENNIKVETKATKCLIQTQNPFNKVNRLG
jgi:hypothetical protein